MRAGKVQVAAGQLETAWWGPGPDDAPTLVLLHEGLGCVALWRDLPERLAAATGWGVFAYSRFGYGQSDLVPPPWPVTYMHHETKVVLPEVLRAAGISRMALLGHSDGGSIAAIYAGSPGLGPVPLGVMMIAAHFFVEDLNIASIRQIRTEYDHGDLRSRLARYHHNVDVAFHGWNGTWLDPRFRDFDLTGFLPNILCPVLGLQGEDDPYGTPAQLKVLAEQTRVPTETVLIPGARHVPHLEAKATTLAHLSAFVAQLGLCSPEIPA